MASLESFRRDLNEVKAVYISEYYPICLFVIIALQLRLKYRLTALTINFYRAAVIMEELITFAVTSDIKD